MNRIEELKEKIVKYDNAYRKGNPLVPDSVYDDIVEQLVDLIGEDDEFFNSSIKEDETIPSERRETLPIIMASMNKKKSVKDLEDWLRLKGIDSNVELILTPKYDGISICSDNKGKAFTRGNSNKGGLRSDAHIKALGDTPIDVPFCYGEAICSRKNFQFISDSFDGDSARNATSGIFRRDEPSDELIYIDYIKYGIVGKDFSTKKEMLDFLNSKQKIKVPYEIKKIKDLTEEYLKELYLKYSQEYELDGLIVEINDISLWDNLGREKSLNPKWACAYKGEFEEVKESVCLEIINSISKNGNIIPVCLIQPVMLDDAMVSRATLNNYSFLREMGIGVGSKLLVKRSGKVIPLITKVLTKKEFTLPEIPCYWDKNLVHLKSEFETDEQKIKRIYSFFKILGVENASDKTFEQLFNSGFTTIKDILSMSKKDFLTLERFGEKKADKIYDAIHSKINNIPLPILQHASNLFVGESASLGSKKLLLLEHFKTKPSFEEILKIDGFSDISANIYLDNIDKFWDFIEDLPITWTRTKKVERISNDLEGKQFVFTGIRDKKSENDIVIRGGIIGSGISSKTTYLIMKEKGSGSSKEKKALELGVLILDLEELKEMLNV
jgi:DNA ligase (NAD+)